MSINEKIKEIVYSSKKGRYPTDYCWDIEKLFNKNEEIREKYLHAGIYTISIGNQLVYIGKSRNMLSRIAAHIFYSYRLDWTKGHKYAILNQAIGKGCAIYFDVLEYCPIESEDTKEIDEWLGNKEGELIRKYLPPLNYQIPNADDYHHFTINKKAKYITLREIVGSVDKL